MRRTVLFILIAAILAALLAGYLFFKTVYLPRRVGTMIDARLTNFPAKVTYEIDSVGLLPPTVTFGSFAVTAPGDPAAVTLSDCTVSRLMYFLLHHDGGEIALDCATAHLVPAELKKVALLLMASTPTEEKPKKEKNSRPPAIAFSAKFTTVMVADRVIAFALSGRYEGRSIELTLKPADNGSGSFVTLSGSLGERRLTAFFNQFPIAPYTRPWLPDEKEYVRGQLEGSVDLLVDPSGTALLKSDLSLSAITAAHPFLDTEPFALPFLRIRGDITADIAKQTAFFNDLIFSIGGVEAHVRGTFSEMNFDVGVEMAKAPINLLVTTVKNRLFDDFLMEGTISVSLSAAGKLLPGDIQLDAVGITGTLDGIKQRSDRLDNYKSGFDYFFTDNSGATFRVEVKNRGITYTPIALIPEYIYRAVVLSEDAGFFLHHGIDFAEMDAAFKDNLTRHELRGGSTITQQLVKNLFLTRNKTILRKFRELLLAVEIDATLPKERILEIYLNIIEWGPGIFGIGQAAQYYFGKLPEELLPHEAAWLASIIPNPKRFQHEFVSGNVSDARMARIQRLMDMLFENGYISGDLYIACYTAPLIFRSETEAGALP